MYMPDHFLELDPMKVSACIAAFPLATVVAQTEHGLIANPFPLMAVGDKKLVGHLARANELHKILPDGSDVLAIFQGDDAYVSPNWYASKAEHHKVVPTWNYSCVHVHGKMTFQHDTKSKIAAVGRLTQKHEKATNGAQAWKMSDAPSDYMAEMLDGIVAFEIEITRVLAKSKLSQNKPAEDIAGVARNLRAHGEDGIADRVLDKDRDLSN
jgi:transcriptional regulator